VASPRVWNLVFEVGNTGRISFDSANPMTRSQAFDASGGALSRNHWRAWIEHHKTGKRIWESDAEKKAKG